VAVLAAAVGSLALAVTLLKRGSYLNALVPAEAPLTILAACGVTWLIERRAPRNRGAIALAAAALVLGAVEVGSLLASPRDPSAFSRPGASSAPGWVLSDAQVGRQVATIERCPGGVPYSGPPYLAFAAHRRMPGEEPDQFIIARARADARFRAAAARDARRCP
jgi:hypothetical protein